MATEKTKKSFDFRMSKKVAELTQVVHMLFTRNHEKEVEIEAIKNSYEHEITLVIQDATDKISLLEEKMASRDRINENEREKFKEFLDIELAKQATAWTARLNVAQNEITEKTTECQNLRDLVVRIQTEMETLQQGVSEQVTEKVAELAIKDKEIDKLRKQVHGLERGLHDADQRSTNVIQDLQSTSEKLSKELIELQELFEETHKTKETLVGKNKQLELDLKNLKKDFMKKVNEIVSSQSSSPSPSPYARPMSNTNGKLNHSTEVEDLRREVQRYRMELSNRDSNFNRMFTSQQPIMLDSRAGRIGQEQIRAMQSSPSQPRQVMLARERTFGVVNGDNYVTDRIMSSKSATSAASARMRLPTLSSSSATYDQRERITRLVKPRPPTRQILSSKN